MKSYLGKARNEHYKGWGKIFLAVVISLAVVVMFAFILVLTVDRAIPYQLHHDAQMAQEARGK